MSEKLIILGIYFFDIVFVVLISVFCFPMGGGKK